MSTLKKDHVFTAGGSALVGGAVGGAIGGLLIGVPGFAIGAVAGTVLGAVLGHRIAEAADRRGDLGHFQQIYNTMPYFIDGMSWDDYAPAYRLGLASFRTRGATPIEQARDALETQWPRARHASRLSWPQAEPAVAHVWDELSKSLGGNRA